MKGMHEHKENKRKIREKSCLPCKELAWKLLITLISDLSDLDVAFYQLRATGTCFEWIETSKSPLNAKIKEF